MATPRKKPEDRLKMGAPTKYNAKIAERICEIVSTTPYGMKAMCRIYPDLPDPDTIRVWRLKYPDFSVLYAKAKLNQADILAEDCLDIADESSEDIKINESGNEVFNSEFAARSRLRVDTRKWLAAKLIPKVYGDRQVIEQTTAENTELKEEIAKLRVQLAEKSRKDY